MVSVVMNRVEEELKEYGLEIKTRSGHSGLLFLVCLRLGRRSPIPCLCMSQAEV